MLEVGLPARVNGKSRIFSSWLAVASYMAHTPVLALLNAGARGAQDEELDDIAARRGV